MNADEKLLADEVKHDPDDYDENGNLDELAIRIKTTNGYKKYQESLKCPSLNNHLTYIKLV